jgi:hypothetical protein
VGSPGSGCLRNTAEEQFDLILSNEIPVRLQAESPRTPGLRDDLPVNEYFLLRNGWR